MVEPREVEGLKRALTTQRAVLRETDRVVNVKAEGGLNIEALEISLDHKRLLIGFRSPLRDGRALIAAAIQVSPPEEVLYEERT